MTETNKMLEECANYLLNTALCWAAWRTSAPNISMFRTTSTRCGPCLRRWAARWCSTPPRCRRRPSSTSMRQSGSASKVREHPALSPAPALSPKAGEPLGQRRSGAGDGGRGTGRTPKDEPAPPPRPAHAGKAAAHPAPVQSGPAGGTAFRAGQPHRSIPHCIACSAGFRPCGRCRRGEPHPQ